MFLSLDLLSEYRIQHGAIGPLYVTSSYSIWIFCRGVSGFATDCPCYVWCRGLTTCLLHVGPPFGNRFCKHQLGCRFDIQYIPRNMYTVFALLCFVVVIHWLIFPYPSGLLHWHCGNITIAPMPAKQPWRIWINTSCEFIMNDCITTTKQSTTKPCAYFLGYTVLDSISSFFCILTYAIIYVLKHHIIFLLYLFFLNVLYFFKYSCTNIFHRRSLCTFYSTTLINMQDSLPTNVQAPRRGSVYVRTVRIYNQWFCLLVILNTVWLHTRATYSIDGGSNRHLGYFSSWCQLYSFAVVHLQPVGRLNKKDGLTRYGDSHVKDKTS